MAALRHSCRFLEQRATLRLPSSNYTSKPFHARRADGLQSTRLLNLTTRRLTDRQHQTRPTKAEKQDESTELPGLSLTSLEVSPRMRMFLIVVLCIFGTIEMITWTIFLYYRFWSDGSTKETQDDGH